MPEVGLQSSAHSSPWLSGSLWWHRHFHVPVAVWILASVLGGAAIGDALEPDGTPDKAPTAVVVAEPVEAVVADGAEVGCASTDVDAADVDGPSNVDEPMYGIRADVIAIDCD